MGASKYFLLLAFTFFLYQADGLTTYRDVFAHKHRFPAKFPIPGKFPFPIPSIPGWLPDTNPWDDILYPLFGPKSRQLMGGHSDKPLKVHLTSDSPAINGSVITFTAKLVYPPCQKEDANGDLVWDEHCGDGMELEASANGQVRSGYVANRTPWLEDYGFGKCTDLKKCNVFPDGKPFPQSNDWRHKSYVYVWHTMGQYYETSDGSSSSLTLNTTNISLGAEVMEVMVYKKYERRKYSPLADDKSVFMITDKIPLAVNISQMAAANLSSNVFFRGQDVVLDVALHDPSGYLKTASSVDYIWDFDDGNQLVTHSNVATHAYSANGKVRVKLLVKAAFPVECPPAPATTTAAGGPRTPTVATTHAPGTHAITGKMGTTQVLATTHHSTAAVSTTTGIPTTEPLPPTEADVTTGPNATAPALLPNDPKANEKQCFRHVYGYFAGNITIIEPKQSEILDVSAAMVTDTLISFRVKCFGSVPTTACTIVSDYTCTEVSSIVCDDVPPSPGCEVHLKRTFMQPGTFCVNITLGSHVGMALASTAITIGKAQEAAVSKTHSSTVVLSTSAGVAAMFAFIAFLVYRRYKKYQPIPRAGPKDAGRDVAVGGRMERMKQTLFSTNEESRYLLTDSHPL